MCFHLCRSFFFPCALIWCQHCDSNGGWTLTTLKHRHVFKMLCCLALWSHSGVQTEESLVGTGDGPGKPVQLWGPLLVSLSHYGLLWVLFQLACAQPWEPELEWGMPPWLWEGARPIISWPHSFWLDSCRPRPVVSIGSAQEAMAASRQQQQYTERAKYTEDSSITCRMTPGDKTILSIVSQFPEYLNVWGGCWMLPEPRKE